MKITKEDMRNLLNQVVYSICKDLEAVPVRKYSEFRFRHQTDNVSTMLAVRTPAGNKLHVLVSAFDDGSLVYRMFDGSAGSNGGAASAELDGHKKRGGFDASNIQSLIDAVEADLASMDPQNESKRQMKNIKTFDRFDETYLINKVPTPHEAYENLKGMNDKYEDSDGVPMTMDNLLHYTERIKSIYYTLTDEQAKELAEKVITLALDGQDPGVSEGFVMPKAKAGVKLRKNKKYPSYGERTKVLGGKNVIKTFEDFSEVVYLRESVEITTAEEALDYVVDLARLGKLFHFDDDAKEIVNDAGRVFADDEADSVNAAMAQIRDVLSDHFGIDDGIWEGMVQGVIMGYLVLSVDGRTVYVIKGGGGKGCVKVTTMADWKRLEDSIDPEDNDDSAIDAWFDGLAEA